MRVFIFDLRRFKTITNRTSNTVVSGTSGDDSIKNAGSLGNNVTINAGDGHDKIWNGGWRNSDEYNSIQVGGSNVKINAGKGNDSIINIASKVTIKSGDGNDSIQNGGFWVDGMYYTIYDEGTNIKIHAGAGNDSIRNISSKVTIDAGNGNDTVHNGGDSVTIDAGAGNDYIENSGDSVTISGGTGSDTILNDCYRLSDSSIYYYPDSYGLGKNLLVKYSSGDGNDIIYGFKADSTLSISGGSYSTAKSGDNIIVTVGKGKITLFGAANLSKVNIVNEETPTETNNWKLSGTTATYGTSSKTLVTVKGVKSLSGLSLSNKTVTVSKAALGTSNVIISDGYTLKLADDVNIPSTTKAWSFKDSKATYKQTTSAGYKLANNAINYSKASSKTLATVSGVKSKDGLKVSGTTITVSNAALNQKKVTVSDGYTLKLGDDVTKSKSTTIGWTKSGSTATYKTASTTAGYKLANNQINYLKKSGGATLATVKGVKNTTGLSVNNKVVTLKKSSLNNKVTLGGSYSFNLAAGDYKKTSIMGSANADIITSNGKNLSINGGKGNDTIKISGAGTTVTGGAGKDVFIYSSGSGKITDFGATDTLRIGDGTGTYSSESSGKNLIVTVGKNQMTLTGAASLKSPNILGTKKTDNEGVVIDGKKVTLTEDYAEENFAFADGNSMLTVDAAAVALDIKITGNKFMNSILGGAGNDTLSGGKGNDKLDGGDGSDVFVYKSGDGNDTILNYAEEDRISIASGTVDKISADNKDVVLTVGNGKITVKDVADKIVTYVAGGKTVGYRDGVVINGKIATITNEYSKKKFSVADYGNNIRAINADAVTHALNITGSGNAESIIGTDGNDTITGGRGGDTLQGGKGADIFVYKKGDGKQITFIDKDGKQSGRIYTKSTMQTESLWFTQDDNNFSTADNQLGSIVKSSASAYSFDTSTDLTSQIKKNNFITYGGKT